MKKTFPCKKCGGVKYNPTAISCWKCFRERLPNLLKGRKVPYKPRPSMKGRVSPKKGRKFTEEEKKRMNIEGLKKGIEMQIASKGIKRPNVSGEKNWKWIKDRSLLKIDNTRNNSAYKEWRKQIWLRDKFTCKIANPDCKGRIEAHHILGWTEFPELRYKLNNGITLCHFHHPRARKEEKRLSPYFMSLVSVSK